MVVVETEREKKVEYVPFIGTVENYIGRSPWDFYSWGHVDMGIAAFLLLSLFITISQYLFGATMLQWWQVMVLTIIFGAVWEFLENTFIYWWGWRPSNRRDSLINALWDIFFVTIGGLYTWLLKWIMMDIMVLQGTRFYVAGIITFVLVLGAYFIGFYFTNKNSKQARKARHKVVS